MTNIFLTAEWPPGVVGRAHTRSQAALDKNQLWQLSRQDQQSQQVLSLTFPSPDFLPCGDARVSVIHRTTGGHRVHRAEALTQTPSTKICSFLGVSDGLLSPYFGEKDTPPLSDT